ncbi:hypothetical protein, partial [Plesiomonas shigelloides]|uniref:hypothetical protein n=1 Tax=Plesiomonas shigelloides TaxID=703 RepID=UPI001C498CEF
LPKQRQEVNYSAILFCCQENVFAFSQEPIFITAGQSVICITAAVSVGSHYRAFCGGRKGKVRKTIHPLHFHPKRQKNTLLWS